jgi:hypothetical protein
MWAITPSPRYRTHLVLPHGGSETPAPGLFLPFDEHDQIHVEFASLSERRGGTGHSEDRALVVGNATAVKITVSPGQLPRVGFPILLCGRLDVVVA